MSDDLKNIFTHRDAADYLGVTPATIKYHVHVSRKLKGTLLNPRMRVFTKAELDALAEDLGRTPGQEPQRGPGRPRKEDDGDD